MPTGSKRDPIRISSGCRGRRKSSHIGSWRSSPSRGRRWLIGSSDRHRSLGPPRRGPLRALCPSSSLHRLFYQFPTAQGGSLVYVMPVDKRNLGRPTAIRQPAPECCRREEGAVREIARPPDQDKNLFDLMAVTFRFYAVAPRRRV